MGVRTTFQNLSDTNKPGVEGNPEWSTQESDTNESDEVADCNKYAQGVFKHWF